MSSDIAVVVSIDCNDTSKRVYNPEVESRDGEQTRAAHEASVEIVALPFGFTGRSR